MFFESVRAATPLFLVIFKLTPYHANSDKKGSS
jgi:hypothetical protein